MHRTHLYRGTEADTPRKFQRAQISYASNAASVIWFKNADISYLLHFPMDGGPLLEVVKNGKRIAKSSCTNGWKDTEGAPGAKSKAIADVPGGSLDEVLSPGA